MYPRTPRNHNMTTRVLAREFDAMGSVVPGGPGGLMDEIKDICEPQLAAYAQSTRKVLRMTKVVDPMIKFLENNPSLGQDPWAFFTEG